MKSVTKLELIKPITSEELFSKWEESESQLPHWIEHYKLRGFNSWRDWRNDSVKDLSFDKLEWNLYEIIDPLETVSGFYPGPFRAWKKKYSIDGETVTFGQLAKSRTLQEDPNVNEIIKNFPRDSLLIGFIKDDKVTIIDGMHRGCAMAVAKEKGIKIEGKIYIAAAEFPGEIPILGQENSPT